MRSSSNDPDRLFQANPTLRRVGPGLHRLNLSDTARRNGRGKLPSALQGYFAPLVFFRPVRKRRQDSRDDVHYPRGAPLPFVPRGWLRRTFPFVDMREQGMYVQLRSLDPSALLV